MFPGRPYPPPRMIRFFNKSPVPNAWAGQIVEAAGWRADNDLQLFLGSDPCDTESGRAIWCGHRAQNHADSGLWASGGWVYSIMITERATNLYLEFPAYVAWILGHELGHALLTLKEPEVQSMYLFVQTHISTASLARVQEWCELPHEQICDRFGRWVAEQVVGAESFLDQITRLTGMPAAPMSQARLHLVLDVPPSSDLPPMLEPLRELTAPYEEELRRLWIEDQRRNGEASYVHGLDPEVLFGRLP